MSTAQKVGYDSSADLSGRTATATGSSNARTLAARAADVVNVKDFGAVGNGVADDTAAIQAAIDASGGGSTVVFPNGTYVCTSALAIVGGNITIRGTRTGRPIYGLSGSTLLFTGATNGIIFSDNAIVHKNVVLDGLELRTSNAGGGKAIVASFPTNGGTSITIRDVVVSVSGPGKWTHGLYGNFWMTSSVYDLFIANSAVTGIYLENNSNALHFYNAIVEAQSFSSRALDVATTSEVYFHGGTLQGAFSEALVRASASQVSLKSVHFENLDASPADGADIVTTGDGTYLIIDGGSGGSVSTGGTNSILWMLFYQCGKAVTLGASASASTVMGSSALSFTDNGGANKNTFLGNRLNSGAMTANKLPAFLLRPDATSLPGLTGAQFDVSSALSVASGANIYAIDSGGTARQMWTPLDGSDQTQFRYLIGKQFGLLNTSGANRLYINDTVLYLYGPTILTGLGPNGSGAKHARVTTGSIGSGVRADVTVTWGTAFADTNYTATAAVSENSASGTGLRVERIRTQAAGSVVVQVMNDSGGALTGTLNVVAFHD